jgi:hypothetical protein
MTPRPPVPLEGVCSCSGYFNCNPCHCREYILILQILPVKQRGQVVTSWDWRKTNDFKGACQYLVREGVPRKDPHVFP